MPFSCASFSANNIYAGLAGLEPDAREKGVKPPQGYATSGSICRAFLNQHAPKNADAGIPGAMLSAKRFIAGVGGRDPASPAMAAPNNGGPPGAAPSCQLADNSLSDVAHRIDRTDHLLLADHDLVEQAFELRG